MVFLEPKESILASKIIKNQYLVLTLLKIGLQFMCKVKKPKQIHYGYHKNDELVTVCEKILRCNHTPMNVIMCLIKSHITCQTCLNKIGVDNIKNTW